MQQCINEFQVLPGIGDKTSPPMFKVGSHVLEPW